VENNLLFSSKTKGEKPQKKWNIVVNFLASFHTHTSLSIHVDHNVQVEKQNNYNLQYQIGCARYIYICGGSEVDDKSTHQYSNRLQST
jgi:hypothetical protein